MSTKKKKKVKAERLSGNRARAPEVAEGVELRARNDKANHEYPVVVQDGVCVCPHCERYVPQGAIIDPQREERLAKREKDLAAQRTAYFGHMASMVNTLRKRKGLKPLTVEQVEKAQKQVEACFAEDG